MQSADMRTPFVPCATCKVENHRSSITRVSVCLDEYLAAARSGLSLSLFRQVELKRAAPWLDGA